MVDLKFIELMGVAKVVVDDCLGIRQGEKVLMTIDSRISDYPGIAELTQALAAAMAERGLDPTIVTYEARVKKGAEIPELVTAAAMEADVLIALNSASYLHSSAFPKIYGAGRKLRVMLLPAGESVNRGGDSIYRLLPRTKEEMLQVAAITSAVGKKFAEKPHTVHFTAANGTDLMFKLGQLRRNVLTGICKDPGSSALLPGGTLSLGIDEGTASGTVVVDAELAKIPGLLKEPIIFSIKDGYATSVEGGGEATLLKEMIDQIPYPMKEKLCVAEFGLGMNAKAELNGDSSEGERILGAAHIGFGANMTFGGTVKIPAWHFDCIIPNATVEVDGELILKDGKYLI